MLYLSFLYAGALAASAPVDEVAIPHTVDTPSHSAKPFKFGEDSSYFDVKRQCAILHGNGPDAQLIPLLKDDSIRFRRVRNEYVRIIVHRKDYFRSEIWCFQLKLLRNLIDEGFLQETPRPICPINKSTLEMDPETHDQLLKKGGPDSCPYDHLVHVPDRDAPDGRRWVPAAEPLKLPKSDRARMGYAILPMSLVREKCRPIKVPSEKRVNFKVPVNNLEMIVPFSKNLVTEVCEDQDTLDRLRIDRLNGCGYIEAFGAEGGEEQLYKTDKFIRKNSQRKSFTEDQIKERMEKRPRHYKTKTRFRYDSTNYGKEKREKDFKKNEYEECKVTVKNNSYPDRICQEGLKGILKPSDKYGGNGKLGKWYNWLKKEREDERYWTPFPNPAK